MANNTQTIADNLPLLAGAAATPTLQMIALIALSAGAVVDSPYLLANGANILAQLGLDQAEQMGVRGLLAFALWSVWKVLIESHKAQIKRLTDQNAELLAELRRLQKKEEKRHDNDETRS